ncbi:hypothetical protein ACCO45_004486 [Purpureocillium lilacinum]|uniref:Uncharacterized protein n=1 Tax=Purpureocillium lilacinum TaxID=33203 RepID=A0ACC4E621_PURLI
MKTESFPCRVGLSRSSKALREVGIRHWLPTIAGARCPLVLRPHERGNLNRLSRPDDQTTWAFPWPSHPSAVYLCSLRRPSFISLFRPLTTVELAHLTTRRYSISHHMMTGIRPNKDTNEATEVRAHKALDDPNISHGDKDGSTSCQRRCDNDLHRALRNPESLRREALERAEAETERHYSMIVSAPTAAAQKGETASKTATPDQIVVQGTTYTRRTGGPLHNMLVAKASLITHDGQDYVQYTVLTIPSFHL